MRERSRCLGGALLAVAVLAGLSVAACGDYGPAEPTSPAVFTTTPQKNETAGDLAGVYAGSSGVERTSQVIAFCLEVSEASGDGIEGELYLNGEPRGRLSGTADASGKLSLGYRGGTGGLTARLNGVELVGDWVIVDPPGAVPIGGPFTAERVDRAGC